MGAGRFHKENRSDGSRVDGGVIGAPTPASPSREGAAVAAAIKTEPEPSEATFSLRILTSLVTYIKDQHGRSEIEAIAESAGLLPDELLACRIWITWAQFERILSGVRSRMGSDEEFLAACSYSIREGYGPAVLMLRAASVRSFWEVFARTIHVVARASDYKILEGGRTWIRMRYTSPYPETRLMCLSRHGQLSAFPTLWGLPAAQFEETECMARGAEACEYVIRWHDQPRWLPIVAGLGLGAIAAALLTPLVTFSLSPFVALPLLGGSLGYILELRRTIRTNLGFSDETNRELQALAREYAEAVEEIMALNERQRVWTRALEEQVTERTSSFDDLVERLRVLGKKRETTLRTFSHDLRNPLTVLKATHGELARLLDPEPESLEILTDARIAVDELDRLINELMDFVTETGRTEIVKLRAVELPVQPQVERLRRRLRALTLGRDIRVSVFTTREVPEVIITDGLVYDRVIDNLLTNAAKYTESGSIVVELTGAPGTLTVKISDTGPGIGDEHIETAFKAGHPGRRSSLQSSYGLGLSIVVRLLDQIGGRLDVMSKPKIGTTFWVHFPVRLSEAVLGGEKPQEETLEEIIGRVVTIRRVLSG